MGTSPQTEPFEGWAIVELMGHRQTAGKVSTVTIAGAEMLRVDTPGPDGVPLATQYYGGAAVYCLTPCDMNTAMRAIEEAYNLPPPIRLALDQARRRREPPLIEDQDDDPGASIDFTDLP